MSLKVIICGDRSCTDYSLVEEAVKESGFKIKEVVSGECKGGDKLGEEWANNNGIRIKPFPADWNDLTSKDAVVKERMNPWKKKKEKYNSNAGFSRNSQMVDYAEAVIALQPNGETGGTSDCIAKARKKGIPVFIWPSEEKKEYDYVF